MDHRLAETLPPAPLRLARLRITAVLGFGLVWYVGALFYGDGTVLPAPQVVAATFWEELLHGPMAGHIGATLLRVAAAFALSMLFGVALGILMGRYPRADAWLDPIVTIFLNVPALVVIVLCYLWIGLNETAAVLAVAVNKTAMVVVTIREGMRSRDPDLAEMAQLYQFSLWNRLRHVLLPQLAPFVMSSVRNGLAVIWKIVLVVEFLGRPNGIGFQIHLYFQLFDVAMVMAYALSFVGIMLVLEQCVIRPLGGEFHKNTTKIQ